MSSLWQVAELQALNPTADATELISAICGDSAWLQEVIDICSCNDHRSFAFFSLQLFDRFNAIMQQADTYIFGNVEIAW